MENPDMRRITHQSKGHTFILRFDPGEEAAAREAVRTWADTLPALGPLDVHTFDELIDTPPA